MAFAAIQIYVPPVLLEADQHSPGPLGFEKDTTEPMEWWARDHCAVENDAAR